MHDKRVNGIAILHYAFLKGGKEFVPNFPQHQRETGQCAVKGPHDQITLPSCTLELARPDPENVTARAVSPCGHS